MLKIGLTGGIGSGKSYVSRIFRNLGVPVYEADLEARRLMETDPALMESIVKLLGAESFKNNRLDRRYIGNIVFSDAKKLSTLNSVVHPVVHRDFETWAKRYADNPYVIEEAAILFESGGAEKMDYVIFIKADLETRISRTMHRDGITREDVLRRISQQAKDAEKEKIADFIINNENGGMILPQIVDLHQTLIKLNKK